MIDKRTIMRCIIHFQIIIVIFKRIMKIKGLKFAEKKQDKHVFSKDCED